MPTPPADAGKLTLKDYFSTMLILDHVDAIYLKPGLHDDKYCLIITINGNEQCYEYRNRADCEADLEAIKHAI